MATPFARARSAHVLLHVSDIERSVSSTPKSSGSKESDANHSAWSSSAMARTTTRSVVPGPQDATLAPKDKYLDFPPHGARNAQRGRSVQSARVSHSAWDQVVFEGRRGPAAT